jgi:N-acetylglucosaminyldiphosphoundecaprenol N-acetyl-beta-D-mannosaminyltransferase
MNLPKNRILGVPVGRRTLPELLAATTHAIDARQQVFTFACANPHSLVIAQSDPEFMRALRTFSAIVADGVGLCIAANLAAVDVGPRITGMDYFLGVMRVANERGGRAFFLGSTEHVLQVLRHRLAFDFPRVRVETLSPPFGQWSAAQQAEIIGRLRESSPDVLWVGMTAPRQEKWILDNAANCGAPVVGAIGAVFDYYAGTVLRAPDWICRMGFEWLYRLAGEPRRLWKRTLVSAPLFFWMVARERLLPGRGDGSTA